MNSLRDNLIADAVRRHREKEKSLLETLRQRGTSEDQIERFMAEKKAQDQAELVRLRSVDASELPGASPETAPPQNKGTAASTGRRKTVEQKLDDLRKQREQLDARFAKLTAQQKTKSRKQDARRKIIVGAAALAHAEVDPAFRHALSAALRSAVTRDIDRKVIGDLLGS